MSLTDKFISQLEVLYINGYVCMYVLSVLNLETAAEIGVLVVVVLYSRILLVLLLSLLSYRSACLPSCCRCLHIKVSECAALNLNHVPSASAFPSLLPLLLSCLPAIPQPGPNQAVILA